MRRDPTPELQIPYVSNTPVCSGIIGLSTGIQTSTSVPTEKTLSVKIIDLLDHTILVTKTEDHIKNVAYRATEDDIEDTTVSFSTPRATETQKGKPNDPTAEQERGRVVADRITTAEEKHNKRLSNWRKRYCKVLQASCDSDNVLHDHNQSRLHKNKVQNFFVQIYTATFMNMILDPRLTVRHTRSVQSTFKLFGTGSNSRAFWVIVTATIEYKKRIWKKNIKTYKKGRSTLKKRIMLSKTNEKEVHAVLLYLSLKEVTASVWRKSYIASEEDRLRFTTVNHQHFHTDPTTPYRTLKNYLMQIDILYTLHRVVGRISHELIDMFYIKTKKQNRAHSLLQQRTEPVEKIL